LSFGHSCKWSLKSLGFEVESSMSQSNLEAYLLIYKSIILTEIWLTCLAISLRAVRETRCDCIWISLNYYISPFAVCLYRRRLIAFAKCSKGYDLWEAILLGSVVRRNIQPRTAAMFLNLFDWRASAQSRSYWVKVKACGMGGNIMCTIPIM